MTYLYVKRSPEFIYAIFYGNVCLYTCVGVCKRAFLNRAFIELKFGMYAQNPLILENVGLIDLFYMGTKIIFYVLWYTGPSS